MVAALGAAICHFHETPTTFDDVLEICIDDGIQDMIQTGLVFLCGPTGTACEVHLGVR